MNYKAFRTKKNGGRIQGIKIIPENQPFPENAIYKRIIPCNTPQEARAIYKKGKLGLLPK